MDSNSNSLKSCVFFDRDGVVNQSPGPGYVLSWEAFQFSEGFFEAFEFVKASGALAVLITSQKSVGKGMLTLSGLKEIHQKMQAEIKDKTGFQFDGIYAFTGLPDCRHQPKPDPEMVLTASRELGIDLEKSCMIGDADRDILMGKTAGVGKTVRILGEKPVGEGAEADFSLDSMTDLTGLLKNSVLEK